MPTQKPINKVAIKLRVSAGFYLGNTRAVRRNLAKWRHAQPGGRMPETGAEWRAALGFENHGVWLDFINQFMGENGVIRKAGPHTVADASRHNPNSGDSAGFIVVTLDPRGGQSQSAAMKPDVNPIGGMNNQTPSPRQSDEWQKVLDQMQREAEQLKSNSAREIEAAQKKAAEASAKLETAIAEAKREAAAQGPVTIVVQNEKTGTSATIKTAHKTLPALILRLKAMLNVYLIGPAGSGKTFAAEQAADALGLAFGFMSVGPQTTKTDILGYQSATGHYVETEFRRRYEHGGLFLFDEIDAGNGGVLTCINAALAGSGAAFPDKMVKRHANFLCIAAGNTFGMGPDRVYVGRQELDGASLDRFNFLEWGYDEGLEAQLAANVNEGIAKRWTPFVQAARKAVGTLSLRHIVSPRATLGGIALMKSGGSWGDAEATQLWKALKPADVHRVKATMGSQGFVAQPLDSSEIIRACAATAN